MAVRDMFHCRNPYWDCHRDADADRVAATKIRPGIDDGEIGLSHSV